MVLKAVVAAVRVSIHFQRDLRMQFLLHADFKIILRVSANIAHALIGISGVVADEAGKQGILERRRREQAVIRRMQDRFGARDVVRHADTRTELHMRVNQVKVVIARARIDGDVFEGRKMVLQIDAGLAAFYSTAETEDAAGIEIEDLSVATAVDEEALQLAQTREVDAGLEDVSMPKLNQVTLGANRERAAGADRKRRDGIRGGKDPVAADALIDGA